MIRLIFVILTVLFSTNSCAEEDLTIPTEIRGVWLTNVDSDVLTSREKISEAMQFLADHNFNLACPVVWNDAQTLYQSALMDSVFGFPIDPEYGTRDPLREVIEEAHKRNIAVIAWFEYGFSSSFEKNGGHILERFPNWAARDKQGNLLTKNGFEWLNSFHPAVQSFLKALITEVAQNYAVDGIQGDDRLPAQPAEGGYSEFTQQLYHSENEGKWPPEYSRDPEWLRWRADKLNEFAKAIYQSVKKVDPGILVTWAPSIYPWSYEEYLQDWPQWLRSHNADLIFPQNYRYSFKEYIETVDELNPELLNLSENDLDLIYPGILMKVGDYTIDREFLLKSIKYNREKGFNGEVFFFYEGLRKDNNELAKALLNGPYKKQARFPFIPRFLKEKNR